MVPVGSRTIGKVDLTWSVVFREGFLEERQIRKPGQPQVARREEEGGEWEESSRRKRGRHRGSVGWVGGVV